MKLVKPNEDRTHYLSLLYTENAKVTAEFWEWRHKVMTRYFAGISAVAVMAAWFYERPALKHWVFVPFSLGFFFSVISDLMDRVNTKTLRNCYRVGAVLEEQFSKTGGIFTAIQNVHYQRASYHLILRWMYGVSAFAFLALAVMTMAHFWRPVCDATFKLREALPLR